MQMSALRALAGSHHYTLHTRVDIWLLLDHSSDPNTHNQDQSTSLHRVSLFGKLEIAHLLVEHTVDVHAKDKGGTAYQIALNLNSGPRRAEIAQLLSGMRGRERDIGYVSTPEL